ncbi:MAG: hypothetical protein SFT93_02965 [Rickettsiaceae bacterium]|nr:hypothetical protein [Rickettsiaceae bacterium]
MASTEQVEYFPTFMRKHAIKHNSHSEKIGAKKIEHFNKILSKKAGKNIQQAIQAPKFIREIGTVSESLGKSGTEIASDKLDKQLKEFSREAAKFIQATVWKEALKSAKFAADDTIETKIYSEQFIEMLIENSDEDGGIANNFYEKLKLDYAQFIEKREQHDQTRLDKKL